MNAPIIYLLQLSSSFLWLCCLLDIMHTLLVLLSCIENTLLWFSHFFSPCNPIWGDQGVCADEIGLLHPHQHYFLALEPHTQGIHDLIEAGGSPTSFQVNPVDRQRVTACRGKFLAPVHIVLQIHHQISQMSVKRSLSPRFQLLLACLWYSCACTRGLSTLALHRLRS